MDKVREYRFGPPITVTATNRLARSVMAGRAAEMEARGARAWERPTVLPWQAWLRELFDESLVTGAEERCLLSPVAEALLWDSVVAESAETSDLPLIHVRGATRSVQEAWRLLCEWVLDPQVLQGQGAEEARWLRVLTADFLARCEHLKVLDGSQLSGVLAHGLETGALRVPEQLSLVGFDELTPAQDRLLDVLRGLGARVERPEPSPVRAGSVVRVALADAQAEIRCAVDWAVGRAAARPAERVALVVPRLAEYRAAILARLEDLLEPARLLSAARPRRALYNVSLGSPLADAPLAHDALAWWRLAAGTPQPLESLSLLLRSPFCEGAEVERDARALLDGDLRRRARPQMTLSAWKALCRRRAKASSRPADGWVRLLERFTARAERLRAGRRKGAEWRGLLRDLLDAVGWPGQRGLDSDEHQQVEALGSVLDAMSGLDAVRPGGFAYSEVLSRVERSLRETLFQPESAPDAPIQVMGPLEAAGQVFDGLWVLGLDEAHWPVPAHPNPFLSYALQRDRGMPHASPARELEYTRRLTARLLGSGREVVVSHPLREGDAECAPSPLIAGISQAGLTDLDRSLDPSDSLAARLAIGSLERFDDEQGPALTTPADVPGGSAVLGDQSACPFRAFARHRLGADAPEAVEPGLDAASFGSLVHGIMELVWGELGGSARLAALAADECSRIVEAAVDTSLATWRDRLPDVLTPGFNRLLRERLIALVGEWLEIEGQRAPFKVVAREQFEKVHLAGLSLGVRVDRIDELEDGSRIVLDYKTGKSASAQSWDQDRLEESQLPLYTVAVEGALGGLALAKVRRDDHRGFEGVAAASGLLPAKGVKVVDGGPRGMAERVERWRTQLQSLAVAFASGVATVDPLKGACDYCGLDLLCRRRELEQAAGADGEEEA